MIRILPPTASDACLMLRTACFFLFFFYAEMICAQAPAGSSVAPTPDNSFTALGARLEESIAQMDWGKGEVSLAVGDAALPINILSVDSSKPLLPGSAMQLLTAAAALDLLGPDFKFATELQLAGTQEKEIFKGSLIVRGGGDPTLSHRYAAPHDDPWDTFDRWAKLLKQRGIHTVEGGVIGDARLFDDQWLAPGWPDELRGMPGLPSVGALNFNHNCVEVDWQAESRIGDLAKYKVFPLIEKYTSYFSSTVRISENPNANRKYSRVPDGNLISASGELPAGASAREFAAIDDPGRYFAEAFKFRLQQQKISISGNAASTARPGAGTSEGDVTLDVYFSPPLREILKFMLWHDSALEAEVLLKTFGSRATGGRERGGFSNGAAALNDWLDRQRQRDNLRVIADGSGRSSVDRISAGELVSVLRAIRQRELGKEFDNLLPQAGQGVLKDRLKDDRLALRIKRHWWQRTRETPREALPIWGMASEGGGETPDKHHAALSGLARAANGHQVAFAFLVSDSKAPVATLRGQLEQLAIALTR